MRILLLAMALALFGIGAAWAQAATYSLTGMGTGVAGTSKCATYQISIDVTVDGKAVKGVFKQQGRPERTFAATLDDKGEFKTKADVGEGNVMDVQRHDLRQGKPHPARRLLQVRRQAQS